VVQGLGTAVLAQPLASLLQASTRSLPYWSGSYVAIVEQLQYSKVCAVCAFAIACAVCAEVQRNLGYFLQILAFFLIFI